jgi:hypothetical protein
VDKRRRALETRVGRQTEGQNRQKIAETKARRRKRLKPPLLQRILKARVLRQPRETGRKWANRTAKMQLR